jgi:periplasmic protein TonB
MTESTARAERFSVTTASQPTYTWTVPQKPLSVCFPLDVIDRLEHEAVESFRSLSSRGSEVGGVLFGTVEPGSPALITVVSYDPVVCDYSRGPLYRLSDIDILRFSKVMEAGVRSGLSPVGFYRSHTRKGLSMDADDVALLDSKFPAPDGIALLIRPFASKPSLGGIFFREDGSIRTESSWLEFPFRTSELAGRLGAAQSEPVMARPAAPPIPAPKTSPRAQIVPIASRREIVTPPPPPVVEPAPPPPVAEVEEPLPPVFKPEPLALKAEPPIVKPEPIIKAELAFAKPEPMAKAEPVVLKPEAIVKPEPVLPKPEPEALKPEPATEIPVPVIEKPEPPEAKAEPVVAAPEPPAPKPEPKPEVKPEIKPEPVATTPVEREMSVPTFGALGKSRTTAPASEETESELAEPSSSRAGKLVIIAVAAALVVLASVALFVYPGFLRHNGRPAIAQVQDTSPLALRVERSGGELVLTWNRDSAAIRNASHAVLEITDGTQHENVAMDLSQLRGAGSISYSPATGDVVFRMEVTGPDQARTTSESVRVLRNRPSPLDDQQQLQQPAQGQPQQSPQQPAGVKPSPATATATPVQPAAPTEETAPPVETPKAPLKRFSTESLAQRLRPTRPADLPTAPSLPQENSGAAMAGLNFGGPASAPPPPPPASAPASSATPVQAKAAMQTGGQIQQAQLLRRKDPEYPRLAKEAGARGTVELMATVGADGKVKAVKVIKGHPLLQRAAIDAVMQWIYRPTILNGVPVETQTQIFLNFVGDK